MVRRSTSSSPSERVLRSPERVAYQRFVRSGLDLESLTWAEMGRHVARWQQALGDWSAARRYLGRMSTVWLEWVSWCSLLLL